MLPAEFAHVREQLVARNEHGAHVCIGPTRAKDSVGVAESCQISDLLYEVLLDDRRQGRRSVGVHRIVNYRSQELGYLAAGLAASEELIHKARV